MAEQRAQRAVVLEEERSAKVATRKGAAKSPQRGSQDGYLGSWERPSQELGYGAIRGLEKKSPGNTR